MVGTIIVCIISVLLCITGALLQKGYEFDFLRSRVPPPQVLYSPSDEAAASPFPTPDTSKDIMERLDEMIENGTDTPANAHSKAALEELLTTGSVTIGGNTYTMPWSEEEENIDHSKDRVLYSPEPEKEEPHTFGQNELTARGKAILNGQILFTPEPVPTAYVSPESYNATIRVSHHTDTEKSRGSIGDDLFFDYWVNGSEISSGESITVVPGEKMEFLVEITENDKIMDFGSGTASFTIPDDIKRKDKFTVSVTVRVRERGGNRYSSGSQETFVTDFVITVGKKIRKKA